VILRANDKVAGVLKVTLRPATGSYNQRRCARVVISVNDWAHEVALLRGWREYHLDLPPGVIRLGDNTVHFRIVADPCEGDKGWGRRARGVSLSQNFFAGVTSRIRPIDWICGAAWTTRSAENLARDGHVFEGLRAKLQAITPGNETIGDSPYQHVQICRFWKFRTPWRTARSRRNRPRTAQCRGGRDAPAMAAEL
jgi:hypothetical protein